MMRKGARTGWIAGTVLLVTACGGGDSSGEADAAPPQDTGFVRVVNVEVETVEPMPFTEIIRVTGTVEASRDVWVSAEESGVVRELFVDKGARVIAGQEIAKLDDAVLQAQVAQARAAAELAEETWRRRKALFEEDGVGSELAYLQAKAEAEQARANLQTLTERLARTVVRAPFAGTLDERPVEVGSMVTVGTRVARIVDLDPVEVTGGVPERFALDVTRGTVASVTFDVLRGEEFTGTVSYVGATVDPESRTFPVELKVPNTGREIKPKMIASILLRRSILENAIVIPQDALVRVEDGFVVFVVEERASAPVAARRMVELGASQSNQVVVRDGLEAGDRLIVVGQAQVAEGDRVRVVAGGGER